jgi:hypothetical protein
MRKKVPDPEPWKQPGLGLRGSLNIIEASRKILLGEECALPSFEKIGYDRPTLCYMERSRAVPIRHIPSPATSRIKLQWQAAEPLQGSGWRPKCTLPQHVDNHLDIALSFCCTTRRYPKPNQVTINTRSKPHLVPKATVRTFAVVSSRFWVCLCSQQHSGC